MAVMIDHAREMRRLSTAAAGLLGLYASSLLYGSLYIHARAEGLDPSQPLSVLLGTASSSSSWAQTLRQVFLDGAAPQAAGEGRRGQSKLSLSVFPGFCLLVLCLSILWARPTLKGLGGGSRGGAGAPPLDNATLLRLQLQCKAMADRVNIGRLLGNVFAVLFIWRTSQFYREVTAAAAGGGDDGDSSSRMARHWLTYCTAMAALGLAVGLGNTWLFYRISLGHRALRQALRTRVRRAQ